MKIDRKEMKREARLAMRDQKPSVYLVTLVFLLITFVLEILSVKLQYPGMTLVQIYERLTESAMEMTDPMSVFGASAVVTGSPSVLGELLDVCISIMSIMISAGFTLFCLNVSRGAAAGFGNLFDSFGMFFKILWLSIVSSIFIFLWSLLFVIPGIVASYRYSLALYILLDDPEKGVMQCLAESKRLTCGCKWQLFVLDLSFLGWLLLSAVPFVMLYTMPYMEVTKANFYNEILRFDIIRRTYA